jgi:GntR family transcriptional regulator/MocR family aminotransferase
VEVHVNLLGRTDLSGEIYRQLRRAILDGRLRPRDVLPPTRDLARRLCVSRTTVTVAYDRLWGEGLVTSHVGAGTFVSEHTSITRPPATQNRTASPLQPRPVWKTIPLSTAFARPAQFDFRTGLPDVTKFPFETWRRLLVRQLRSGAFSTSAYGDPAGDPGLRQAIARHIGVSRGVHASVEDIVITNGTQQAIDVVARVLVVPGDRVAVEDPGYVPPRLLFQSLGARVVGIPVDRHGLVVDQLPNTCRLVHVTPSHQYPQGMSMSPARRLELLEWARQHNAGIIEDDYDTEFRFGGRPLEPLQTLDTSGRVIYVGSFSKTMLPTLRLGFAVLPPSLRDAAQRAKYVTDWHTSSPAQAALASFIDGGGFARHLRKMNTTYRARHELLSTILARDFTDQLEVIPSAAGLHVTAIARRVSVEQLSEIVRRASAAGVEVQQLSAFAFSRPAQAGLVMGYGVISTDHIEEGLQRLRSCFR